MKIAIFLAAAFLSLQVAVMHSQQLTSDDLICIQENTRGEDLLEVCTEKVLNSVLEQNVS